MSAGAYVKSFAAQLEQRLVNSSLELEDAHLEAAIDAQLSSVRLNQTNSNPIVVADYHSKSESAKQTAIFDDYVNPDSVENCLSPFVPSHSARIDAMVKICKLGRDDVLLDIGCGDGRVCLATVATTGCKAIGIDVSPLCIARAKETLQAEGLKAGQCDFFEVDATIDPNILLKGEAQDRLVGL